MSSNVHPLFESILAGARQVPQQKPVPKREGK